MTQPLVSIVITNYNYGRFIKQAINSALNQSYTDIEVIVVDDGSTDESVGHIKSYGSKVKLITQPNQGVVIARNNGAKQAKGQYLVFLDADDYLADDYVSHLINTIKAADDPQVVFAYSDFQFTGQTEQVIKSCAWNPRKLLYRNYIVVSALVSKPAFDEVGGFDQAVNQQASFEDWDLWLSLVEQGYSGVYCPMPLFYYRLHGTGRNGPALEQRTQLEQVLHQKHPKLYQRLTNKMYLAVMGNLNQLKNKLKKPPGT